MLRAGARLPDAAAAVEVIGMKFDDFGTCAGYVLCHFEPVSTQNNKVRFRGKACRWPNSGTFWLPGCGHYFHSEVNHQEEAGDDPT